MTGWPNRASAAGTCHGFDQLEGTEVNPLKAYIGKLSAYARA